MSRPVRVACLVACLFAWGAAACQAQSQTYAVKIAAGEHDRLNTVVKIPLTLPADWPEGGAAVVHGPQGVEWPAQLVTASLALSASDSPVTHEVVFVLPSLRKGETVEVQAAVSPGRPAKSSDDFEWVDTDRQHIELKHGTRPVARFMNAPLDETSKATREQTYKVFHHLFDPRGERIVTKGPGGLYTHHRGLFFGFNKITYDGKSADIWHCTGDTYQSHDGVLSQDVGSVLGRHRLNIGWHGRDKELFARESRELAFYQFGRGQFVEFSSQVKTLVGPVKLDGDPQHAGFHFRADNEVAEKTKDQTYYLRPDGKGKPGETRNWDPKTGRGPTNMPWNALSFVLGDQRYTAVYLDHPQNPREARYSERDYGRFGSYFEYEITAEKPLFVQYRLWLQEGEMTLDEARALHADFVTPVAVTVERS